MSIDYESEWVTLAMQLQTLVKARKFKLSGKQKKETDTRRLLGCLNTFLNFNLNDFASGKAEVPVNGLVMVIQFFQLAVTTCLFNESDAESNFARIIVDAMIAERVDLETLDTHFDLVHPQAWLDLLAAISPVDKATETEFDIHETRSIFRNIQQSAEKLGHEKTDRLVLMGTLAARLKDNPQRKEMVEYVSRAALADPDLATMIADQRLINVIVEKGGVPQLLRLVASCLQMTPESGSALESNPNVVHSGSVLRHLANVAKTLPKLQSFISSINGISASVGISEELVNLVMETQTDVGLDEVFSSMMVDEDSFIGIDAQRLVITIIRQYKIKPSNSTLRKFARRISLVFLEPTVLNRLLTMFNSKAKFTQAFISQRLNIEDAKKRYADSSSLDSDFFWLNIIAMIEFQSHELCGITRCLAALYAYRKNTRIDDRHYQLLVDDFTSNLPSSLSRLYAYPENTPKKLRQLYIPLSVAAELDVEERVDYLSDAYHALARHDRQG